MEERSNIDRMFGYFDMKKADNFLLGSDKCIIKTNMKSILQLANAIVSTSLQNNIGAMYLLLSAKEKLDYIFKIDLANKTYNVFGKYFNIDISEEYPSDMIMFYNPDTDKALYFQF